MLFLEIADIFIQWKKNGDGNKKTILKLLSEIDGVYIPCFFISTFNKSADLNKHGIQILKPKFSYYAKVKKACLADISKPFFSKNPIVPFAKPVHDRLRLEIARGCSKGCRFCQAGMIYRPVRERKANDLIKSAKNYLIQQVIVIFLFFLLVQEIMEILKNLWKIFLQLIKIIVLLFLYHLLEQTD